MTCNHDVVPRADATAATVARIVCTVVMLSKEVTYAGALVEQHRQSARCSEKIYVDIVQERSAVYDSSSRLLKTIPMETYKALFSGSDQKVQEAMEKADDISHRMLDALTRDKSSGQYKSANYAALVRRKTGSNSWTVWSLISNMLVNTGVNNYQDTAVELCVIHCVGHGAIGLNMLIALFAGVEATGGPLKFNCSLQHEAINVCAEVLGLAGPLMELCRRGMEDCGCREMRHRVEMALRLMTSASQRPRSYLQGKLRGEAILSGSYSMKTDGVIGIKRKPDVFPDVFPDE
jgi:hypothetical protein